MGHSVCRANGLTSKAVTELLQSARVRRGATTAGLGIDAPSQRFYLNERLTISNKHVFYPARQAATGLG
ncbi:unnamed protein product [Arctia plantaginis]|uniref:Uncharacterized protein n=1 Tax=Arctia plantaginis TaxID=874455 RepID=A0A8S0YPL5_ARCPL|nr:unnamed protein product [Arctia plantaginis]